MWIASAMLAQSGVAQEAPKGNSPQDLADETRSAIAADQRGLGRDAVVTATEHKTLSEDEEQELANWLESVKEKQVSPVGEGPEAEIVDAVAGERGFLERARHAIEQARTPADRFGPDADPLYVLVSMSMPKAALLDYFKQAQQIDRPVIFVVRGFDPDRGGLQALVDQILDANSFEVPFAMNVHPQLFEQTETDRVPVFVGNDSERVPKIRRGGVSLFAALESIEKPELDLTIGATRPIAEPNLLAIIKEKIRNFDGTELVKRARENVGARATTGSVDLPVADSEEIYFVDPTIVLRRDIRLPNGRLVARRGAAVNPLEAMPWTQQYVVFDARSDWQVDQAAEWAKEGRTTFVATRLPSDEEEIAMLGTRLGSHVHLLHQLMVGRMGLRAVPSRISQANNRIQIQTATKPTRSQM